MQPNADTAKTIDRNTAVVEREMHELENRFGIEKRFGNATLRRSRGAVGENVIPTRVWRRSDRYQRTAWCDDFSSASASCKVVGRLRRNHRRYHKRAIDADLCSCSRFARVQS